MIGLFLLTVIVSLLFYITAVIMYLSNRNIFKNKGDFRKFDDYDLTIKVKDFSVNKDSKFYNLIFTTQL